MKSITSVTARAAAKVNIGWRVGARRDDGYHDVSGCVQTVDLTDVLRFDVVEAIGESTGALVAIDDVPVRLDVDGDTSLQTSDNLVLAAARAMSRYAAPRPTRIHLHKAIPVAAGLGGGSADAAATLAALNVLWGARVAPRDLLELAAGIGSDVPALLVGGLVHVGGRGERVRRIGSASTGAFVLGISDERISAAETYAAFDDLPPQVSGRLAHNDLEAAACALLPQLAERVEAMSAATGCAFVSGSGPTVVGVCAGEDEARAAAEGLTGTFAAVEVARPVTTGVSVTVGAGHAT